MRRCRPHGPPTAAPAAPSGGWTPAGPPPPPCFLVFVFSRPPTASDPSGPALPERSKTLGPVVDVTIQARTRLQTQSKDTRVRRCMHAQDPDRDPCTCHKVCRSATVTPPRRQTMRQGGSLQLCCGAAHTESTCYTACIHIRCWPLHGPLTGLGSSAAVQTVANRRSRRCGRAGVMVQGCSKCVARQTCVLLGKRLRRSGALRRWMTLAGTRGEAAAGTSGDDARRHAWVGGRGTSDGDVCRHAWVGGRGASDVSARAA